MVGDFLTLVAIGLLGLLIGGPIWLAVALRKPLGMEWVALVLPMGLGVAGLIIGVFAAFGWFRSKGSGCGSWFGVMFPLHGRLTAFTGFFREVVGFHDFVECG